MSNLCPQCGAPISNNATKCEYCGTALQQPAAPQYQQPVAPQQQGGYAPQQPFNIILPIKSKIAAGILAILLGSLGIHKFYLGQGGLGFLYLIFCWTGIPSILGIIDGIIILTQSDQAFMSKYRCRLG